MEQRGPTSFELAPWAVWRRFPGFAWFVSSRHATREEAEQKARECQSGGEYTVGLRLERPAPDAPVLKSNPVARIPEPDLVLKRIAKNRDPWGDTIQ